MYRGSRKHVLDWVSDPVAFVESLNAMLAPSCAVVSVEDSWMPRGYDSPDEARLESVDDRFLDQDQRRELHDWWLRVKHPLANTPNLDVLATCKMLGRKGLIIVEAKAHTSELENEGDGKRSEGNKENHQRIAEAIEEARSGLVRVHPGAGISRDSHYQFSNRTAFAWKLASMGVPTVLMYLGFTGDKGLGVSYTFLQDEDHWQSLMAEHTKGLFPRELMNRAIPCGASEMWLLIRAKPVLSQSPPPEQENE